MHWFQGRQIRTRDLDGIARNGENDNVFPGMEFIFVFDHLGSLPIILNAGALEGELFDLDGDGAACLGFDDGDVVFGLAPIHVHHPRLRNDTPNHDILGLPILRRIRRPRLLRIILHHMLSLSHHHLRIRHVKQQRQRPRSLLNQPRRLLGILDIDPIHFQQHVPQLHSRRTGRRSLHDERNDRAIIQRIHELLIRLKKQRIHQLLRLKEHDSQRRSKDFGIVPFSTGRQVPLLFGFGTRRRGFGGGIRRDGFGVRFRCSRRGFSLGASGGGADASAEQVSVVDGGLGCRGGGDGRGGGSEAHVGPGVAVGRGGFGRHGLDLGNSSHGGGAGARGVERWDVAAAEDAEGVVVGGGGWDECRGRRGRGRWGRGSPGVVGELGGRGLLDHLRRRGRGSGCTPGIVGHLGRDEGRWRWGGCSPWIGGNWGVGGLLRLQLRLLRKLLLRLRCRSITKWIHSQHAVLVLILIHARGWSCHGSRSGSGRHVKWIGKLIASVALLLRGGTTAKRPQGIGVGGSGTRNQCPRPHRRLRRRQRGRGRLSRRSLSHAAPHLAHPASGRASCCLKIPMAAIHAIHGRRSHHTPHHALRRHEHGILPTPIHGLLLLQLRRRLPVHSPALHSHSSVHSPRLHGVVGSIHHRLLRLSRSRHEGVLVAVLTGRSAELRGLWLLELLQLLLLLRRWLARRRQRRREVIGELIERVHDGGDYFGWVSAGILTGCN
mmetsp:Transcript_14267/g.26781  ORF Transcript_14267/g.26781 Transcript_14267/m.26781 type:complete len:718 (-) Transcript_14267:252-2405(-)